MLKTNNTKEDPEGTNHKLHIEKLYIYLSVMCLGFTLRDSLATHCTVSLLICVSCKYVTQYGSCHMI